MENIPNDNDLVERLQKGDVEAFDLVYARYAQKIYTFSLKYLKSTSECEELVQGVFLKLWENHKGLRLETSFKSYMYTITYNDICKSFRRRSYHQKFVYDTLYENRLGSSEMEEGLDYKSVIERITKIIEKLTERQKTIFLKSRYEGKSTKEIALELNLSPGTVDNYISETLKIVRSKFRKEDINMILFLIFIIQIK